MFSELWRWQVRRTEENSHMNFEGLNGTWAVALLHIEGRMNPWSLLVAIIVGHGVQ